MKIPPKNKYTSHLLFNTVLFIVRKKYATCQVSPLPTMEEYGIPIFRRNGRMRYYYDYRFPIGNLTIEEDGHGICGIYFGTKTVRRREEEYRIDQGSSTAIITVF